MHCNAPFMSASTGPAHLRPRRMRCTMKIERISEVLAMHMPRGCRTSWCAAVAPVDPAIFQAAELGGQTGSTVKSPIQLVSYDKQGQHNHCQIRCDIMTASCQHLLRPAWSPGLSEHGGCCSSSAKKNVSPQSQQESLCELPCAP